MHDDNPSWGTPPDPWNQGPAGPSAQQPWVPSEPPNAPDLPPGAFVAPGPDNTPTRLLPGGVPSWAPPGYASTPVAPLPAAPDARPRRGVSRRAVLIGAGAVTLGLGAAGTSLGFWLSHRNAIPDVSNAGQIFHLLRRAGFGARPGEIGEYLSLGVSGSIDRLLDPASVPDDLDTRLSALHIDLTRPLDMQRWFLLRMIYSKRPLEEKMTLFWHGVLTSSYREVGGTRGYPSIIPQNQLLRTHALGRFDDLIRAITIDPAMMWYLDLRVSTAQAPNENYARELMELFTMGLSLDGVPNYTQNDVVAGARALTGWTLRNGKAVFVPGRHDGGTKAYLGHTGTLGLDDVVQIVCEHPATPYHIAWRMWNFFVAEKGPNVTRDDADLKPLVDAYHQQHHSIAAMMRALLTSPAFFSPKAYRQRIKSPAEFVVGAIRALEQVTDGRNLPQLLTLMGQELFNPPNVSGWDGDKVSSTWLSTQAWMTRVNFINALLGVASAATAPRASGGTTAGGAPASSTSALQTLINTRQIATRGAFLDFFAQSLLDNQLDADRRATISDYLAQAASAPTGGPALTLHGSATLPAAAARGALYLLMSMPEYQLS